MFCLQEKLNDLWFDIYESNDIDLITRFRMSFVKKYPFKKFRIVEVII